MEDLGLGSAAGRCFEGVLSQFDPEVHIDLHHPLIHLKFREVVTGGNQLRTEEGFKYSWDMGTVEPVTFEELPGYPSEMQQEADRFLDPARESDGSNLKYLKMHKANFYLMPLYHTS